MKIKALLFGLMLLAGCSSSYREGGIQTRGAPLATQSGAQVAQNLTNRYFDTRSDCGSDSRPAFLCSGVDLRGTDVFSASYDSWNPSPTAERVGGVSFSFFRSDYKMNRLANFYTHGFIFYPVMTRPAGKAWVEVLCFFPIDGVSDSRPEHGCGMTPGRPQSDRCDRVGVTTGEEWAAHYNLYGNFPLGNGGCAMDVSDAANAKGAPNFYQGMRGGRLITPKAFERPNDLKHALWPQNIPATLPIEAFFYTQSTGLSSSRLDQQRFYALTGIAIPIIYLKLPGTLEDRASFTFIANDQAVSIP